MDKCDTYNVGKGKLIKGDCLEVLKTLEKDSAVLAFTSPPYHNAINYSKHIEKLDGKIENRKEKIYPTKITRLFWLKDSKS